MEHQFWHQKWRANEIGFHENDVNHLLAAHYSDLRISSGDRFFLPLCGKTRDIAWLLSKGHKVAGVELSEVAVKQLFEDLGVEPEISNSSELKRYRAESIDIFVGDLFALSYESLGNVHAVYDRAALVALPGDMRTPYCKHLSAVTRCAPQLLITFDYDQNAMAGPPFSISTAELQGHYADIYQIDHLAGIAVKNGLKGQIEAVENAWLLTR
ncbi:MAG: thiopurine S-methyltransferase [Lysobacterales bacterium]